jgi:uncharacterized membrane protein (DUF373 family)
MVRIIRGFEFCIVMVLILLMMVAVFLSTIELAVILWQQMMQEPKFLLGLTDLLKVLGFFMMVLIGLELLETIKNYLTHHALHVEIVLLVAMIAVARKVILIDMKEMDPGSMFGVAALLISLAASYYLIRRVLPGAEPKTPPSA